MLRDRVEIFDCWSLGQNLHGHFDEELRMCAERWYGVSPPEAVQVYDVDCEGAGSVFCAWLGFHLVEEMWPVDSVE